MLEKLISLAQGNGDTAVRQAAVAALEMLSRTGFKMRHLPDFFRGQPSKNEGRLGSNCTELI